MSGSPGGDYAAGAEGCVGILGMGTLLILGIAAGIWVLQAPSLLSLVVGGGVATFCFWVVFGGHIADYRFEQRQRLAQPVERQVRLCERCGSGAASEHPFMLFHPDCPARTGRDREPLAAWARDYLGRLDAAVDHRVLFGLDGLGFTYSPEDGWLSHEGRSARVPLLRHRDLVGRLTFLDGFESVDRWAMQEDIARALVELVHRPEPGGPALPDVAKSSGSDLSWDLGSILLGCGRLILVAESQVPALTFPGLPEQTRQ